MGRDVRIAPPKDGTFRIDLNDDLMEAKLTVAGPFFDAALNEETIKNALGALKIVKGVRDRVWAEVMESLPLLKAGETKTWLIAKGEPAVDGENAKFISMFPSAVERKPHIDEHDVAHFRELGTIISVSPGERVMERTLPTGGEDGYNVLGQLLEAVPGIELNYAPNLKGVDRDPEDERVLVATIVGQPVIVENGCIVEPVYVVKNVGLHTGNIDFDGSVLVKGDVAAGMQIIGTGDVTIGGTVEASVIQAGGNVVVKQGIIGTPTVAESVYHNVSVLARDWDMRVLASGSVTIGFASNAYIAAKGSIEIKKSALHSFVRTEEKVKIGHDKAGGGVVGGTILAKIAIDVEEAGSPVCVRTFLGVGLALFSVGETQKSKDNTDEKKNTLQKLEDSLLKLSKGNHPHKAILIKRGLETVKRLKADIGQAKKQLGKPEVVEGALEGGTDRASVIVRKRIHCGVTVSINTLSKSIDDSTFGGQFIVKDGEIVLEVPDHSKP